MSETKSMKPPSSEDVDLPRSDGDQILELCEQGVDTLVIGAADINGQFRCKRFSLALLAAEEVEIAFSDYLFGCDVAEELITPRESYTGYFPTPQTGLPDIFVRPDWHQLRILPWEPRTAVVLGDYTRGNGEPLAISPRAVLRRVVERIRGLGYEPMAGSEYEFMVYRGSPEDVRRDPTRLEPLSHGPAYGHVRGASDDVALGLVRRMMDEVRIPIEAANPEAAPGQCEITIRYSDACESADRAFLYKQFVQELLAREGLTASFIARPDMAGYGSSGHIHTSLREGFVGGSSAFVDSDGTLSKVAGHAIAGLLATLKEFTCFYAPFVNSYRRYQTEYAFAGDNIAWGIDNRSCAIRAVTTTPESTRLENRSPGSDMNPYVALAATLAAIGHGLEERLDPPPPVDGDPYAMPSVERVPDSPHMAVALLDRSAVARDWLGNEFVDFYAETRHWDAEVHRLELTPWELGRYL